MKTRKRPDVAKRCLRHGHTVNRIRSKTHNCWVNMRQRCTNQNDPQYERYGGRGIRVCERWNVFENFLKDMGESPDSLSIERIDNNSNYEPNNCRWATSFEQTRNKRTSLKVEFRGNIVLFVDLCAQFNIVPYHVAYKRIKKLGWNAEMAVSVPSQYQPKRKTKAYGELPKSTT